MPQILMLFQRYNGPVDEKVQSDQQHRKQHACFAGEHCKYCKENRQVHSNGKFGVLCFPEKNHGQKKKHCEEDVTKAAKPGNRRNLGGVKQE